MLVLEGLAILLLRMGLVRVMQRPNGTRPLDLHRYVVFSDSCFEVPAVLMSSCFVDSPRCLHHKDVG